MLGLPLLNQIQIFESSFNSLTSLLMVLTCTCKMEFYGEIVSRDLAMIDKHTEYRKIGDDRPLPDAI